MQHVRSANPFALMLDPQAVLNSIAQSERLEGLQRRICRPLDKPMVGAAQAVEADDLADDGEDTPDLLAGPDGSADPTDRLSA